MKGRRTFDVLCQSVLKCSNLNSIVPSASPTFLFTQVNPTSINTSKLAMIHQRSILQ